MAIFLKGPLMPCIELSLPKVSRETKAELAAELTDAFCDTTGHSADIFGIRFFEYDNDTASAGGKLCDAPGAEPYLHVLVYCPRLTRSSKQKMGAALTEAFARAVKRQDWVPFIHICEHPYDNVIVGGRLLTDAYEECAKRTFYYELPKD
jgi:phenylpyruvate tautomerase PptA (4-oxalocrotonate tautomerase family)